MSSDETPKIEPEIDRDPTLILNDAPPIAAVDQPPAIDAKAEIEAPKADAKIEPKIEPVSEKIEPKVETLPPAAQIATPVTEIIPFRRPDPKPEMAAPAQAAAPRSGRRFAMLAACVAFAASVGALGGSIGVAKLGPMFAEAKPPVLPVAKDHVADEVKALKDTVAQLRTTTKSLSDNLAALKTSVNTSNSAQNTQIGKIAETLDRVEKSQAEQRKTAAAQQQHAAPETTGSIAPQKQAAAVPMVLGEPPTTLKPPTVPGYVLRRVYDGAALIESRNGMIEVEPGIVVPGLGRIEDIKRQDGHWVVITSRGIIAMAR